MSAAYARLAEDERPEPAQLIDFTVEVDGIDLNAGPLECVARDRFRISCSWIGSHIAVDCIEAKIGREWLCIDECSDRHAQALVSMIREYYRTPSGQTVLRDACDDQETNLEELKLL